MKRIIKNITSTIVAIAILFSTLGLQIYSHSCKSHNFFAASFIEKPECEKDHPAEEVDDCCKTEEIEEVSCCDVEINVSKDVSTLKSEDPSCCQTSINASQVVDNLFNPVEKKNISIESDFYFLPYSKNINQNSEKSIKIISCDLPPPLFGKTLLKTIHQLKLDTPFFS